MKDKAKYNIAKELSIEANSIEEAVSLYNIF